MLPNDEAWQKAYAKQSLSDLDAREALALSTLPVDKCHRLHFLQMAAEKVCKAHLVAENGHANVRKTHAYVATVLPQIARQFYGINQRGQLKPWQARAIRRYANEIELLAPACDDGGARQDNSEYPWLDGSGAVQTPCLHKFSNIDDDDKSILILINLIRVAAQSYAE